MTNDAIERIKSMTAQTTNDARDDHAAELSMRLRDMLMNDFRRPESYMPAEMTDSEKIDILDELDRTSTTNAEMMPNAFIPPNDDIRRDSAEMLDLLLSLDTDDISQMRLRDSLCPMHACDYAICFDDDDAECAQIRQIFPSHDT